MRKPLVLTAFAGISLFAGAAAAATLSVGPGKTYAAPCAAFAAAADGDTIEIDAAGSYVGDVCHIGGNNLTIKGVGGRAKIDAGGTASGGKAIWVVGGKNTTVEDVEMFGCAVPDQNGAAIRQEGDDLTLRRVFFHDNQDGLLTGASATSTILIEDSEFANNGAGDGYSHNMYIGAVKSFTLQHSYSHDVKVGHLVKSRALENHILYNRITDQSGTASYEIDVPQGGNTWIVGNVVEQSPTTQNPNIIAFAEEGLKNPTDALFVVNNTIVNDLGHGTFVDVGGGVSTAAILRNNIYAGGGTLSNQASSVIEGKFEGDPGFVDPATFDYHLKDGSAAADKAIAPGVGDGLSLSPICQYVHVAHAVMRKDDGTLDLGAFEIGGETSTPCGSDVAPGDAGPGVDSGPVADGGPGGDGGPVVDSGKGGADSGVKSDAGGKDGGPGAVDSGGGPSVGPDAGLGADGATDGASPDSGSTGGCSCAVRGGSDGGDSLGALTAIALGVALALKRRARAARVSA